MHYSKALSAVQKLLLISITDVYGIGNCFSESIKTLVNEHPCSRKSLTEFLKKMESRGFLVIEKSYGTIAPNSYLFTNETAQYIQSDKVLREISRGRFIKVIRGTYVPVSKISTVESISNLNRFFLLILILHSNSVGSVNNLSFKELAEIMGGTKDQVKSQIICLKKAGLIRYHVPGISHKYIFGIDKSIFLLNIKHPFINDYYLDAFRLTLDVSKIQDLEYLGFSESSSLIMKMPTIHLEKGDEHIIEQSLLNQIISKSDVRLHDHIQFLIFKIASNLLSSVWDNPNEDINHFLLENLKPGSNEISEQFIKLIRTWGIRQARIYESLITFFYGKNVSYEQIFIFPNQKYLGRFLTFEVFLQNAKISRVKKKIDDAFKVLPDNSIVDKFNKQTEYEFDLFRQRMKHIFYVRR